MRSKAHWLIFAGIIGGAGAGLILSEYEGSEAQGSMLFLLDIFGKTIFIGAL